MADTAISGELSGGAGGVGGPLDQGKWGECVIFALTGLVNERLMFKYDKVMDVDHFRILVVDLCEAETGAHVSTSIRTINACDKRFKLSETAMKFKVGIKASAERTGEFDRLCEFVETRQHWGVSPAIVVASGVNPGSAGLHAMMVQRVDRKSDGTATVRCVNSWGASRPFVDVDATMYTRHVEIEDVVIEDVQTKSGSSMVPGTVPDETERYKLQHAPKLTGQAAADAAEANHQLLLADALEQAADAVKAAAVMVHADAVEKLDAATQAASDCAAKTKALCGEMHRQWPPKKHSQRWVRGARPRAALTSRRRCTRFDRRISPSSLAPLFFPFRRVLRHAPAFAIFGASGRHQGGDVRVHRAPLLPRALPSLRATSHR